MREPQRQALRILAEIDALIEPHDDLDAALEAVREAYPGVESFERDFVNLCFTLATGVGKTRLMGAFVAYLALTGRSRNFFVLAPSTTIYEKLITDFSQKLHPKYVFKGLPEFAQNAPVIVTGETWVNSAPFVEAAHANGGVVINIFNVDKINRDRGRVKRLNEYLGESYFDYLSSLDDLVMLMDEAHRYRNDAAMRAIAGLNPMLGVEVTATPRVSRTGASFRNVVYEYGLAKAMQDGFIKEPAVGTRANWQPGEISDDDLDRVMLEDGVHYHEHVRVALEAYSLQHGVKRVHPFILVVTSDIAHAKQVKELIESDAFFGGRYRNRVIDIHSGNDRVETEKNARQLLRLEETAETDIVIHVNQLKEGWDVTNLYTIVPLRRARADVLLEQTLGRGLRLPFGKRTGVDILDTLTVINHHEFERVIERARSENSILRKTVTIGEGGSVSNKRPTLVTSPPLIEEVILPRGAPTPGVAEPKQVFAFENEAEQKLTEIAYLRVLPVVERKVRTAAQLSTTEYRRQIAADALTLMRAEEGLFSSEIKQERAEELVATLIERVSEMIIEIPRLTIVPREEVSFRFQDFDLSGLQSIHFQPRDAELIIQQLRTDKRLTLSQFEGGVTETRPENYIVRRLVDFEDIDYESNAALLYKLAGQAIAHLKSYLKDDDEALRQVLIAYADNLAQFIHGQMRSHMVRTPTTYDVRVTAGFTSLRRQHFETDADTPIRDFRSPPNPGQDIRRLVFGGFNKACYRAQKFDSDAERRFAVILEDDSSVIKWLKPSPDQFVIEDRDGHAYQPDFVVETQTEKLIVEPKNATQIDTPEVQRKTEAALLWCHIATEHHAKLYGGKPWRYAIVPDTAIGASATLSGLLGAYSRVADMEMLDRLDLKASATG